MPYALQPDVNFIGLLDLCLIVYLNVKFRKQTTRDQISEGMTFNWRYF